MTWNIENYLEEVDCEDGPVSGLRVCPTVGVCTVSNLRAVLSITDSWKIQVSKVSSVGHGRDFPVACRHCTLTETQGGKVATATSSANTCLHVRTASCSAHHSDSGVLDHYAVTIRMKRVTMKKVVDGGDVRDDMMVKMVMIVWWCWWYIDG